MPRKCTPCLSEEVKNAIREKIKDPQVLSILEITPSCIGPELMELCSRKKRPASAYQLFVGACLKQKKVKGFDDAPGKMRECAAEWQKQKGKA